MYEEEEEVEGEDEAEEEVEEEEDDKEEVERVRRWQEEPALGYNCPLHPSAPTVQGNWRRCNCMLRLQALREGP
eukprot:7842674-Pyramimonas_sp.AAC.1